MYATYPVHLIHEFLFLIVLGGVGPHVILCLVGVNVFTI
jgi:hypothetical protein